MKLIEQEAPLYKESYRTRFAPLLLIALPPLAPFLWRYEVVARRGGLKFGYRHRFVSAVVPFDDITSAEPLEYLNGIDDFRTGYGVLRYLGVTGFIARHGPGVRITVRSGPSGGRRSGDRRVYLFSCEDPEQVCRIINGERTKIYHGAYYRIESERACDDSWRCIKSTYR
uniref:Uncharacterized protein n=1 Tax=Odontella aurita TaxID=265563 RepID=A0A7S4HTU9_9STRA|mmetsp:Transcript_15103/g.43855  ORF Transcript_15103/g.43855 Transcript_15103/m.43855 type:complete len:170 (+) Transcript_15103:41-550(+)